jgi:hypothetical protein
MAFLLIGGILLMVCLEKDKRVYLIPYQRFDSHIISSPKPSDTCVLTFYSPFESTVPEIIWFEDAHKLEKDAVTGTVG